MIAAAAVEAVNADPALRRWGRLLSAEVLLEVGAEACRLSVREGRIDAVTPVTTAMAPWTVAFRAEPAGWARFMAPEPSPGFHDVMALVKRGCLRIEGDLRPFMQHIFWFKGLFAAMREAGR